jgi:hypothetical protein
VTEEIRRDPSAANEDGINEAWERLTDEPSIRDVIAVRWDDGRWQVIIRAQEFFRQDPVGDELRERMASALESVDEVTRVADQDNETWSVRGTPSGEALTRAAAKVLDDLADRLREGPPPE